MPKFQKDGTEWIVLGLSPQSMIEQMKKLTQSEDTTEAFIQELQNHLARVHENRSKN
jgi:hypothetical protein